MKRLHNNIEETRNQLKASATASRILFHQQLFDMILGGCSEDDLRRGIEKIQQSDSKAWHLTHLLPKVTSIHNESHRVFSQFRQHFTIPMDEQLLRDLQFAMLAKIDDFRPLLGRAGLDRKEVRRVEGLIEDWFDREAFVPQEVYILLKDRTGQGSELRMFAPPHPTIRHNDCWTRSHYYLLRFEVPVGVKDYEFRLGNQTKSQQFTNIGKQSYFAMQTTFENEAASKLETMTYPEELCVISLLLGEGERLVQFLDFLASESEINRRNSAYSKLKLLKEGSEMRDIDSAYDATPAAGKLLLCYCLSELSYCVDGQIPNHYLTNNFISKLLVANEIATQIPNNARLAELDNCFRMNKLLADYIHNGMRRSNSLFNSLLHSAGQKYLLRLTDLLEVSNVTNKPLVVEWRKLEEVIQQSHHNGYQYLLMLVSVLAGSSRSELAITVASLTKLAKFLKERPFVQSVQHDTSLKERINKQFEFIAPITVKWEENSAEQLKQLSELLSKMEPPYFELIWNSKIKNELIARLSILMKCHHPEAIQLLVHLFLAPGNILLRLDEFEHPFKDLMSVRRDGPSLMSIPDKAFLKPFFLEVLFPLFLRNIVSNALQNKIWKILSENIVANKLTFRDLLDCISCDFQDVRDVLKNGLCTLLNDILTIGYQSTYDWKRLLTNGGWISVFEFNKFLQDLIVDDLVRRLKALRATAAETTTEIEDGLEQTFLNSQFPQGTPEVKVDLVTKLFELTPPTKDRLRGALLDSPSRIRAYWLLMKVGDKNLKDDILKKTSQIKEDINNQQLNRKQLRFVVFNTKREMWKTISELFDSQAPSLQVIMENIEMKCQNFILDLKKCDGFCRGYEPKVPSLKPELKRYEDKLVDFGEQSLVLLNFALPDLNKRLCRCVTTIEVPLMTLIELRVELSQRMTLTQLVEALQEEIKCVIEINRQRGIAAGRT